MTEPINIPVLASVNVITYNHINYIVETLEGILKQKTDFLFDVVICDDYSTDGTRSILETYKRNYPDKIILRLREKNLGLKYNYFDNINACSGKYVAICEGDDFWTNENKLQQQIDFLEAHQDYSMCFQNAVELHDYKGHPKTTNSFSQVETREYQGEEILSNWLIPTASVVFRKNGRFEFRYLDDFLFYDIVLFLRLCEQGRIYCMNEAMCVYRRHSNSITNSNLSYKKYLRHLIHINLEFKRRYEQIIKKAIAIEYTKQAKYAFKKRSVFFLFHALKSVWYDTAPIHHIIKSTLSNGGKVNLRSSSVHTIQ